jgi:hypothetical protein
MNNPLPIPSEEDWLSETHVDDGGRPVWDLDQQSAFKEFGGKSHAEAFALFCRNAFHYQESVFWMPARCFGYYVLAYVHYLDSELSKGDADGANAFFGLVEFRHVLIRNGRPEVRREIVRTLHRLAGLQDWYDADRKFYEDFAARSQACLGLLDAG